MIGDFVLPLLILIVLAIIGLTAWLVFILTKGSSEKNDSKSASKSHRPASTSSDSILSVQKNQRGLWEVRVLDVSYQKIEDIPDPEVRSQVVDAIKIVAAFGRDYIAKRRKAQPEHPAPSAERAAPVPQRTADGSRLHQPSAPPQLIPQINLAKEIGEILEEMQKQRSSLAKRSIRLQNAPDGGVRFVIDGRTYTSVGEIPDLEVQALIRDATREWERR
jgi:FtsZ-interacting cell division protein ZipA